MKISQKRVKTVENYLTSFHENEVLYVAYTGGGANLLNRCGFIKIQEGSQILPSVVGAITRFNAQGSYIKDRPHKETYYVQREWTWEEYNGDVHTKIVEIARERFRRIPIQAPSEEIKLHLNGSEFIGLSRKLRKSTQAYSDIKHVINLFLEIFGECDLLREDLLPAINIPTIKVNWTILPIGSRIDLNTEEISGILENSSIGHRPVTRYRLQNIIAHNPNFLAVGNGGFKGYLIFGFSQKEFYLLESFFQGNATYVLGVNWEAISQLSKREILENQLHIARFEHREGWIDKINDLLN